MFRWFLVLVLAAGIAGGVAWYCDLLDNINIGAEDPTSTPERHAVDIGTPLYKAQELKPLPETTVKASRTVSVDPCYLVARYKQDISCPKDGQLLFIGQQVTEENALKPSVPPLETAYIWRGDKKSPVYYKRWEENDVVDFQQMVGLVDPALALNEVKSKDAKIISAEADHQASVAIYNESVARVQRLDVLRASSTKGLVAPEDYSAAVLTRDKYFQEEISKREAINSAKIEKQQADIVMHQHELRSNIKGKAIIKRILQQNGNGLRAQEPIVQLYNLEHLKVEGMVDGKDLTILKPGMKCILEPTVEVGTEIELKKVHRMPITSVAVCGDGKHFVSGSQDGTVYLWERGLDNPVGFFPVGAAVRTVACSPPGSAKSWLLVGCTNGSIYVWDLGNFQSKKFAPPIVLKDCHRGAVTALAFSPDGTYFASGGDDNMIQMWNTAHAKLVYPFDADHGADDPHQGTITALHFTPQAQLVSAARDNTLRVWDLGTKGAKLARDPIDHRGGTVPQLGVSHDGRYMLFDQGKTLQLVNVADSSTAAVLENFGATTFETMALFSPDGSLLLTGSPDDGRIHLWKAPTPQERGYRVRELVSKDRAQITCAAFAPGQAGFAVSGSKEGYVHIWTLPSKKAVDNHRIVVDDNGGPLRLDVVERILDSNKTRIAANVLNPQDPFAPGQLRLVPGQRVTLVVVTD